jgi:hypothetical protein
VLLLKVWHLFIPTQSNRIRIRIPIPIPTYKGAAQAICLLCLLNDRAVIRVCVEPIKAMLLSPRRVNRVSGLRCVLYLAHNDDEKASFAGTYHLSSTLSIFSKITF